jgi:hypothetical protein
MMATLSLNDIIIPLLCIIAVLALIIWFVRIHLRWLDKLTPEERKKIDEHSMIFWEW